MKKIILLFYSIIIALASYSQTTAVNFNADDCSGVNHDLFTELNSGKVILLDWVMPCSSCLPPSKTAYNVVQSYATSNPGKVFMYISDDYANTNCTTLGSWVDNNGMPNAIKFSNSKIKMSNYGLEGMPKIIIMGGINHTIFFNEINSAAGNVDKLKAGINAALAAASNTESTELNFSLSINPNPAKNNATVSLTLKNPSEITIELFNSVGQKIMTVIESEKLSQGPNAIEITTENIANGIYFLKVTGETGSKTIKLSVSH